MNKRLLAFVFFTVISRGYSAEPNDAGKSFPDPIRWGFSSNGWLSGLTVSAISTRGIFVTCWMKNLTDTNRSYVIVPPRESVSVELRDREARLVPTTRKGAEYGRFPKPAHVKDRRFPWLFDQDRRRWIISTCPPGHAVPVTRINLVEIFARRPAVTYSLELEPRVYLVGTNGVLIPTPLPRLQTMIVLD